MVGSSIVDIRLMDRHFVREKHQEQLLLGFRSRDLFLLLYQNIMR